MLIDTLFASNETVEVSFLRKTNTEENGQVTGFVWAPLYSAKALFYRGSAMLYKQSDQFKADVKGTILLKPKDYTKLQEEDKAVIGTEEFSVMFADNVGNQNQGIIIPVKAFT